MIQYREEDYRTVTVISSEIGRNAAGATALILRTQEVGAIAFSVSLESIAVIREELTKAETILRQPHGHS